MDRAPRREYDRRATSTALHLAGGGLAATFLPEVGMLGASLTADGSELLSLHGGVERALAGGTNGLPLLAPWANRLSTRRFRAAGVDVDLEGVPLHTDENGLAIHGTMVGARRWEVLAAEPARVRARFDYTGAELLRAFPFPHRLELDASLADGALRVETALEPLAERAVPVAFGWHPYFRLPGPREEWTLELPACERLELDGRGIPTGRAEPQPRARARLSARDWDDHFALGDERAVAVAGGGLRLEIRYGDGYDHAQVFSPRARDFVAVEPMTSATDALTRDECPLVAPGSRFAATFEIAVG